MVWSAGTTVSSVIKGEVFSSDLMIALLLDGVLTLLSCGCRIKAATGQVAKDMQVSAPRLSA
jgi:hypothetical protein